MVNNFLTTIFSVGAFGLLLADSEIQSLPLVPAVFLWLSVGAAGIILVVKYICDVDETRRLRERNHRLREEYQQSYNMMFLDMNKRLNEAQRKIDELLAQQAANPVKQPPRFEAYFEHTPRPRRFLNLETGAE